LTVIRRLAEWLSRRSQWSGAGAGAALDAPAISPGESSLAFALALHARLRMRNSSLVFSPHSLRTVLGMAAERARGDTLAEMRRVVPPVRQRFDGIDSVAVANALWVSGACPLAPSFVEAATTQFGGAIRTFQSGSEATRDINEWVARQTGGQIRDLVKGLDELTLLILVNAIHFRARWAARFEPEMTHEAPFHAEDGSRVPSKLMTASLSIPYTSDRDCQVVTLEYDAPGLELVVILPSRKDGLVTFEAALGPAALQRLLSRPKRQLVLVMLPRFSLSSQPDDLRSHLASIGMPTAFDPHLADFSGINGVAQRDERALHVSDATHRATIDVDEDGTTAAAATAMRLARRSAASRQSPPEPPVFRADHPFLFAVRHVPSEEVLFFGRVANPLG